MKVQTLFDRLALIVLTSIGALAFFTFMAASAQERAPSQPSSPTAGTSWKMLFPDATHWVTATLPFTIQVQVTDTAGLVPNVALYEKVGVCCVSDSGFPNISTVSTVSLMLAVPAVTLTEGMGNIITFTVFTSDTLPRTLMQSFTLTQDSVAPTGSISWPVSSTVWSPGDVVSVTWAITDTTSGLSNTQVWFRLSPLATPVYITSTSLSVITWTVPIIDGSNQARILLKALDKAGNTSLIQSQQFTISSTFHIRAYLPYAQIACDDQAHDWCEPNDTPQTGFPLALNRLITASINMTTDQYDYYIVHLDNARPYTATSSVLAPCVDVTGPICDIDLYLYTVPTLTQVAQSNFQNRGNEQFVYTPTITETGAYALLVYAYNTTVTPTIYTLIVK